MDRGLAILLYGGDLSGMVGRAGQDGGPRVNAGLKLAGLILPQELLLQLLPVAHVAQLPSGDPRVQLLLGSVAAAGCLLGIAYIVRHL